MNILLISQCRQNALKETRRILDQFAERCGERTWQTPITRAGLTALHSLLKQTARKNTAVACYWTHGKNLTELLWIVGDRKQFNAQGRVPTNRTARDILRSSHENPWQHAASLQIVAALAALLHDLGKATSGFQKKLKHAGKSSDPYRHEWLSLRLFQAMIEGCASDEAWLGRLKNWQDHLNAYPRWYENIIRGNINCDFSRLPPLAKWIGWLIVSHHRLPFYDIDYFKNSEKLKDSQDPYLNQSPDDFFARLMPADRWVRNPDSEDTDDFWTLAADPTAATLWQKDIKRWADKALRHQPLLNLCAHGTPDNPLLLHLSRLCLMSGDHNYSSLKADDKCRLKGSSTLAANTDSQGHAKQSLDEHLCGVARFTARFAHLLPLLHSELPTLTRHRQFQKPTGDARFQWQNKAFNLAKNFQTASSEQGFFGVNLASTGCGKTLANARIMYALADPERGARFTVALGLRVLTLQTGQALSRFLGFEEGNNDCLATLVGGAAVKELFEQPDRHIHAPVYGSESADRLINANDIAAQIHAGESEETFHIENLAEIRESAFDDALFGTLIHDSKACRLLNTPIVSCTIDHLMQLSEQQRGGRYIVPMLRLLTSDLILDEPDDFSTEDLPALSRLVYWAGLLGSRVLLSSATLTPDMVAGLHRAYQQGRDIWNAQQGRLKTPVVAAWFDEFNQHIGTYSLEDFAAQHQAFCQKRAAKLAVQPVRRKAEWLPVSQSQPQALADALLQHACVLHDRHHQTDPNSGKNISIGLIRFANINPMVKRAYALFEQTPPEDTAIHIACYHSQKLLLLRSRLEKSLDRLLNRKKPQNLFTDTEIQTALAKSSAKNHIFIVMGTAVTEVGRDHDYDWAIIEPSSMRSIIQLAGRVWRHRPDKTAQTANIGILSKNIKALNNKKDAKGECVPAYCRPGFESKTFKLPTHDAQQLINADETDNITAIARLTAPASDEPMPSETPQRRTGRRPAGLPKLTLCGLEHEVMRHILNNSEHFTARYRQTGNAAPFSSHHARISPFRQGQAQTAYTAFWDEYQQKTVLVQSENAWLAEDIDCMSAMAEPLNIDSLPPPNPHIFTWLSPELDQALAEQAGSDEAGDLFRTARQYATVNLRNDPTGKAWRYNAWSGFWQDSPD